MKSLMSFVFLIPMILAAAPSRALSVPAVIDDRCSVEYCPQPFPRPGRCPVGTHRVFDEYQGRYICVQDDTRGPRPLPWGTDRIKELSGALGGDDMSVKGAALNGLFDAAMSGKTGEVKDAVAAPASSGGAYALTPRAGWRLAHTDPSVPLPSTGTKPRPKFLRVDCTDSTGCKSPTVQKGVDVIKDAIDLYNKAQNYKREIEENEKKYQEGTKKWKDDQEKKHNPNVS